MKFLFRLFLLFVLAAAGACAYALWRINQPFQGFSEAVYLDFPTRTRTEDMALLLAERGVVEKSWMFLAARALSPHSVLQAGEYEFAKPASALEVFARIARGDTFFRVFVAPEGYNLFDIAKALDDMGLIKGATFLKAARAPALVRDLDPSATTLEGYLFPDSYKLNKHSTAESLCRAMVARFRQEWKLLETNKNVHDTVTLASLVEREARLPEERPKIAAVFRNRLAQGMKLDCDPTTVYAALLENRYRGKIYRSDLDNPNPYNTYHHAGLPPGPIAKPGLSSLKAAIRPAETDALYFVAKTDGSGGHTFSRNYSAHLAAAAELHAAEKNR